ncbi:MAG: undecaprenyl/decaprenyl-phosphate alpha-N-acetylglucosaminyl 1-phosphate transferase [Bacteroidetes bacterium]|nr:undecaprenyl/decaprenyl-phosphate alpha-N-acetylglucosaminyl 1-phosphate transferase [Bacteroidota bacterium]
MQPLLSAAITAFIIALASIPSLIRVAKKVELYDEPDERKLHPNRIPLLGGMAIFAATIFSFTFWAAGYFEQQHLFIVASLIILFFLGLRDDIMPLQPIAKIFGQAVAAMLVVLFCNIRLLGMHGLFGIHALPLWLLAFISILVILFIINAYNLIDGVDGLAGGLGIIASATFGILFYCYNDMLMAVLAFSLCGALIGFLIFNFHPAKIFMGDTGSMTIGFILAILSLRFVELTKSVQLMELFNSRSAPVMVLAILIIPIVDTLRVFTIRIVKRRSPFSPDRNHIHHKLLQLGLSSRQVTVCLYLVNILFISAAYFFRDHNSATVFYGMLANALLFTQLPHVLLKFKKSGKSPEIATPFH